MMNFSPDLKKLLCSLYLFWFWRLLFLGQLETGGHLYPNVFGALVKKIEKFVNKIDTLISSVTKLSILEKKKANIFSTWAEMYE